MKNGWWWGLLQLGWSKIASLRIKQKVRLEGWGNASYGRNSFSKLDRDRKYEDLKMRKVLKEIKELEGQCDQNTNSKENSSKWDWILETSASTNYLEGM